MATAKTGSFYLTETVTLPAGSVAGTRIQGTLDLGAYVNVGTGQAVAIDQVDFIWQAGTTFNQEGSALLQTPGCLNVQLSDLNPGTAFVRADDHSLIASGALNIDTINNITSEMVDIYPDNFGARGSLSEMFMVVNDSLHLVAGNNGATTSAADDVFCTARIRCRLVTLGKLDWVAIAIQSVASDN